MVICSREFLCKKNFFILISDQIILRPVKFRKFLYHGLNLKFYFCISLFG
jgi:hypothetical protein